MTTLRHAFKTMRQSVLPHAITLATPPPASVAQALQYLIPDQWAPAHSLELDQWDQQGAITWLKATGVLAQCNPMSLKMTYKYTLSPTGAIKNRTARCSVYGTSCDNLSNTNLIIQPPMWSTNVPSAPYTRSLRHVDYHYYTWKFNVPSPRSNIDMTVLFTYVN